MIKAFFIDFYGTVVHEDGEVIRRITQEIADTGSVINKSEIDSYWWNIFQKSFMNSYGDNFETQRNLEYQSLLKTVQHFSSTADANKMSNMMFEHWMKPPIFEESKKFFQICPIPIYVVSNIDRADVLKAIEFHELKPTGVFTSEDAKSYKPRKELFELALKTAGLSPNEVLHIGDSMSSDVKGATNVGINAIWINRSGKEVPEGVQAVSNLLEIYKFIEGNKF